MKALKDSSIIICSIVRDASRGLKKNIPVVNAFLKNVKDYKIVIFENDSIDNTKELLINWKKEIGEKNFHLCSENRNAELTIPSAVQVSNVNPFYSEKRISKMVALRNQYMDYIFSQNWECNYLMIVDLDVFQLNLKGIIDSFNLNREWDAICANGYSLSPKLKRRYHDSYALTEWGDQSNPQTERKIKELSIKYGKLKKTDPLIRVYSAFGGLAIYKYEALKGLRYKLLTNSDPRVEVKCEHYSIYKQMINNGFDKIYINSKMILKYQGITIKLLINWIIRQFDEFRIKR